MANRGYWVAHIALQFGPGHERGDGVDDDDIEGVGFEQCLGDGEGLLTGRGLRDQQFLDFDAEATGIFDVEGVFRIDERGDASILLRLGDRRERQGRFAG